MVVVGILGVIMASSIPAIHRGMKKAPMRDAVKGIKEACSHARARAILSGSPTQVVFHPREGIFSVAGGTGKPKTQGGSGLSGELDESVVIELLDINLMEFRDEEVARVNFNPNGTCDEFLIILKSDEGEQKGIVLEITTGLSSVLNEDALRRLAYR